MSTPNRQRSRKHYKSTGLECITNRNKKNKYGKVKANSLEVMREGNKMYLQMGVNVLCTYFYQSKWHPSKRDEKNRNLKRKCCWDWGGSGKFFFSLELSRHFPHISVTSMRRHRGSTMQAKQDNSVPELARSTDDKIESEAVTQCDHILRTDFPVIKTLINALDFKVVFTIRTFKKKINKK